MSLWNDFVDPVFDGVGLAGEQSQCFSVILIGSFVCLLLFYLFLPSTGWLCGVGVFGLIVFSLSPDLPMLTIFE